MQFGEETWVTIFRIFHQAVKLNKCGLNFRQRDSAGLLSNLALVEAHSLCRKVLLVGYLISFSTSERRYWFPRKGKLVLWLSDSNANRQPLFKT